jgi:hypothetical protein
MRDAQAFQRDLKHLAAATGWILGEDSIADGQGWRFTLDEPSLESTVRLSVVGFGAGRGRLNLIVTWRPVTEIITIELADRHDDFIREDFAEALTNEDLRFVDCGICRTVRQGRLHCQDDDYCAGCAAEHYLSCPTCLRGEGEPDDRSPF